jgi:hypothetical protein
MPTLTFDGTWTSILEMGNAYINEQVGIVGRNLQWGVRWNGTTNRILFDGVELNEWSLLAATYQGTTLIFYVNGVEVGRQEGASITIADDPAASRFRLSGMAWTGNDSPDSWNLYTGYLGRARVHSAALTPEEVLGNYDAEKLEFGRPPHTITASAGPGGTIDPEGAVIVYESEDQEFIITPNIGYEIEDVLVDTVSQGAIGSYEFLDVVDDHTISATFLELPTSTVSGTVTDGSDPLPDATIYFNTAANASVNPTLKITTGPGGTFSAPIPAGTWYVCASAATCLTSADLASPLVLSGTPVTGVDFVLTPNGRNIPAKEDLLFSVITESFAAIASGNPTGPWPLFHPLGGPALTTIGAPQVEDVAGVKWEQNLSSRSDGYQFGPQQTTAIPMNGATIVAVYRPTYMTDSNWNSIVDIMYSRLVLGINNANGELFVNCQGTDIWGGVDARIPDGDKVVLSLVVQPNGDFTVYSNGVEMITGNDPDGMTSLDPTVSTWNAVGLGYWSYINVGRNSPDGWTVVNGNIGDVFIYKVALDEAQRQTLEADLAAKFDIGGLPATPTPLGPTPTVRPPTTGIEDWSIFK